MWSCVFCRPPPPLPWDHLPTQANHSLALQLRTWGGKVWTLQRAELDIMRYLPLTYSHTYNNIAIWCKYRHVMWYELILSVVIIIWSYRALVPETWQILTYTWHVEQVFLLPKRLHVSFRRCFQNPFYKFHFTWNCPCGSIASEFRVARSSTTCKALVMVRASELLCFLTTCEGAWDGIVAWRQEASESHTWLDL